jgi:hypothetical protein
MINLKTKLLKHVSFIIKIMPIFVEWKWIERTQTLLVVFHFWDNNQKENLRMRIKEYDYEQIADADWEKESSASDDEFTSIVTCPEASFGQKYPKTGAYLSWAPSHPEFCLLTEVLTYANLINGLRPHLRRKIREKLQGRLTKYVSEYDGKTYVSISLHSELIEFLSTDSIVSFSHQTGVSFEVRLEYIEYLRKLMKEFQLM